MRKTKKGGGVGGGDEGKRTIPSLNITIHAVVISVQNVSNHLKNSSFCFYN